MTELGERLAKMTVRSLSPDRQVRGVARGKAGVTTVSFAEPGAYEGYQDAAQLESQITYVLEHCAEGIRKGRRALVTEHTRFTVSDEPHWDLRQRRAHACIDRIQARGASVSDLVRIDCIGMRSWRVRIKPGTLERLKSSEFLREVNTALVALHQDQNVKVHACKKREYGELGPGEPARS